MPASATTPTAGHLDVGDTWLLGVKVQDDKTKKLLAATVTFTVTRPDATTAVLTVTNDKLGYYSAGHVLNQPGQYTAIANVSGAVVSVVAYAATADPVGLPTLAQIKAYLGSETSRTDAEITEALAAEIVAQSNVCRVSSVYPADLAEALKRRVQRNLYMRGLPSGLETINTEAGGMGVRISTDPEIRRLEAPYRRLAVA